MKKILIAGGTGFVGGHLISFLLNHGYALSVLTRHPLPSVPNLSYYVWDTQKGYIDPKAFEDVDTIINLAGANIGEKRWTPKRRQLLVNSRVASLRLLYRYVSENAFPIKTIISSSAVGYYGMFTSEEIFTETHPAGTDFLSTVCIEWEKAAQSFEQVGARVIILRKGVIISPDGGFWSKMAPLASRGINPALGTGRQYVPWMDIRDLVRLYDFLLQNTQLSGVFNAVGTPHLTLNQIARRILSYYGKRKITPNVPAILVRLLFGKMAGLLLEGSRVSNEKLQNAGFVFESDLFTA